MLADRSPDTGTYHFDKENLSQPKDARVVSLAFLDLQFNSDIMQVLMPFNRETQGLKALQIEAFHRERQAG